MQSATIRQCAILVGGLGSRLGELTATVPKPLLRVGDRPFLAWLMRELQRYGVNDFLLLTGHLSDAVEAALPRISAALPKPARIRICREPVRAGTGGALHHAGTHLAERFLLCNGDSLLDFNLAHLLAEGAKDGSEVIGRMVLRRLADTSRYGVVELDGDHIAAFHQRPAPGQPGTINAGIYLLRREILADALPLGSLERDILPKLAMRGALRGTVGTGYFIDIGIPEDLVRAQTELPTRLWRRALFLDRDGVLNIDHGHVGTIDRFHWMPGALQTIGSATDAGMHVFVVTNQSGIGRGYYDENQFAALTSWMSNEVLAAGGTIDDLRYCPHHPNAATHVYRRSQSARKPSPEMILDLIAKWEVDTTNSLLIGDQPTDLEAAANAGIKSHQFCDRDLAAFALPLLHSAR